MTPIELAHLLHDYVGAVQDFFMAITDGDEAQIEETIVELNAWHNKAVDALVEIFPDETEH